MGGTASVLASLPQDQLTFYDAFKKMRTDENMTDSDIYTALKKKFDKESDSENENVAFRHAALFHIAKNHFSETLETNRSMLEVKKRELKLENSSLSMSEVVSRSYSSCHSTCDKAENGVFSYLFDDDDDDEEEKTPPASLAFPSGSLDASPKVISLANLSAASRSDDRDSKTPDLLPKTVVNRFIMSLAVRVDTDDSDEGRSGQGSGPDSNSTSLSVSHKPQKSRRDADHVSPSGSVHVGKFSINESGLRREGSTQRMTGHGPQAFLTAGKSDFVETGFLGAGASGSVVEALHIPTLTIVALKMLRSSNLQHISSELTVLYQNLAELHLVQDCLVADQENQEASNQNDKQNPPHVQRQSRLTSPCEQVLALYDAFVDSKNGMVSLVVEYMDGGSLQDLVDRGGCQDEATLADITRQGLLGLEFLHDKNCIHRDIKPGNILVNCAGIVKLADFGIAKAMDANIALESAQVGTMCYMAPERMVSKPYGRSSDIWSFGLTLLAVVLGRYPLLKAHEKSDYWAFFKVICDEPPPQIGNEYSYDMQSFIEACLFKDPAKRSCVKTLLSFPFVQLDDASSNPSSPTSSTKRSTVDSHKQLSACTSQRKYSTTSSPGKTVSCVVDTDTGDMDSADVMFAKFKHLETILENIEMKYEVMVELWNRQQLSEIGEGECWNQTQHQHLFHSGNSYRSVSVRSASSSVRKGDCSVEPMTRLPNFVSGLEQWKHLASQLRMPLQVVLSTASTIINPDYFVPDN